VVAQVASRQVVHDQVQVFSVLERVVHVDDEQVLQLRENLALIYDRLDTALGDNACLGHLFHRVKLLCLFALDSPHFAESTLSDAKVVNKVSLRNSCNTQYMN